MAIRNNRIIVDLNKVQYAHFYYTNQYGISVNREPNYPTVRSQSIAPDDFALFHPDWPKETILRRAMRLGLLDVWTPTLYLKLQANSCLIYTGDKAISIYNAWKEKVFGKK